MSFSNRELSREGVRGPWARRSGSILSAVIAAVVAVAVVVLGQLDVNERTTRWKEFARDGGYSYAVVGSTAVSQYECDTFRGVAGVRHSGAIRGVEEIRLRIQPDAPAYLVRVTPGLVPAMFPAEPEDALAGVIAGSNLAALGLDAESEVSWTDKTRPETDRDAVVGMIARESGRSPTWDDALVIVEPADREDGTCIVEFDPAASPFAVALAAGWFSANNITLDPILDPPREGIASLELIGARPTTLVPLLGGIVVAILVCAQWWGRRNEFVIYRLLGLRHWRLWRVFVCETLVVVVLPALIATAGATLGTLHGLTHPGAIALGWDLTVMFMMFVLLPVCGLILLGRVRTTDAIRGR